MFLRRSLFSFILTGIFFFACGFLLLHQLPTARPWGSLIDSESNIVGSSSVEPHDYSNPSPNSSSDGFSKDITISSPLLRVHLKRFLELPVLSHAQSIAANEKGCPREIADKHVNQDQLRDLRQWWIEIDEDEIQSRRMAIVSHLEKMDKQGVALTGDKANLKGKGIVMTAGNRVQFLHSISQVFLSYLWRFRTQHQVLWPVYGY